MKAANLNEAYREIKNNIYDWVKDPKKSSDENIQKRGVLRRLDYAFGLYGIDPNALKADANKNGLLQILKTAIEKEKSAEVQQLIDTVQKSCLKLKECLNYYFVAEYQEFENRFSSYMDCLLSYANVFLYYEYPVGSESYRMRTHFEETQKDKRNPLSDMFHIPFTQRYLISTQRYSIPGYPSLYSADTLHCAWEEMDRPSFDSTASNIYKTIKKCHMLNLKVQNELKDKNDLKFYILSLPLIVACSFHVKDEKDKFVPEYTIPQQVYKWLMKKYRKEIQEGKSDEELVWGISFTSSKDKIWTAISHKELKFSEATNHAFLAYLPSDKGGVKYSDKLANLFEAKAPVWYKEKDSITISNKDRLNDIKKDLTKKYYKPMSAHI